ncbi:unnamed protein product [Hyaloperonospora brassicae]|uniref:Uncharacterized protein n=1 Tax=Hyaloperonospora brassicae TaxID=162125 RepID=A0AAV0U058_HYABA|nr:unnamed protein product [Hyaloperonospora brassicae]
MAGNPKQYGAKKQQRAIEEEDARLNCQEHGVMNAYPHCGNNPVWKRKCRSVESQNNDGAPKAVVSTKPRQTETHNSVVSFQSAERLADWMHNAAKRQTIQLSLKCGERSEEVRDALLRQFHRWPATKLGRAEEQYQELSQQAEERCQHHVQLYIQELRGNLMIGAKALFWLNVLHPMIPLVPVSRQEAREVLMLFLDELKSVDGVYTTLTTRNPYVWDILTLPLRLEPLFHGVSTLALNGHGSATKEAIRLMMVFAAQYAPPGRKKATVPTGLSIVASVGILAPPDILRVKELPQTLRDDLVQPFLTVTQKWLSVVDEVLGVLTQALTKRWVSRERAPYEKERNDTFECVLQSDFARLNHALATDQLYVARKTREDTSSVDGECLNVHVVCDHGGLFVQLDRGNGWK